MSERIIVSLTTWSERMNNLPTVLNSIEEQSVRPDHIVLNLAYEETIPNHIQSYLDKYHIEVFRVPDTKVYKKLIPTLKRYPNDIVINIDDDWLYPHGMIADFIETHHRYPNHPISGNRVVLSEMICHCGCASLTKLEYFQPFIELIDNDIIHNCPCDDIVYTYFANKAKHPYITTKNQYFLNMTPITNGEGYSAKIGDSAQQKTLSYLIKKYGELPSFTNNYLSDPYIANILYHIHYQEKKTIQENATEHIRNTIAYNVGKFITSPFSFIRHKLFTK